MVVGKCHFLDKVLHDLKAVLVHQHYPVTNIIMKHLRCSKLKQLHDSDRSSGI